MKIALKHIQSTLEALKALDGPETARFKYGSKVTWNRSKNIKLFSKELESLNEEGQRIFRENVKEVDSPTNDEIQVANRKFGDFQKTDTEIPGVLRFKLSDLCLYDEGSNKKGNNIPASVLGALMDLIDDDSPEAIKSAEEAKPEE